MKLVMTSLTRADPLPGGEGGLLEMETSAGTLQMRFTYQDATRLIDALRSTCQRIQAERVHSAKPPLPGQQKIAEHWETAIDPVNQDAVIRARFTDRTTQETRIPRSELAAIARFLGEASRRFESGAEMRQ
jgi:hypothetical protein